MYMMGPNLLKVKVIRMYGHDYEKGHTCPTCGKSGIRCTIEDGFCENAGDCDDCIKERYMRQESDGYDDNEWENECQECGGYVGDNCTCEKD